MLSRQEKMACYNLGVWLLAVAGFAFLWWRFGRWLPATAAFGVCGLWGIGPVFFFGRGKMRDYMDERDLAIQRTSTIVGYCAFWGVFVITVMSLWHFHRAEGCVPVEYLPLMVFGGMMVLVVIGSISTLVLYRRGVVDGEG